MAKRILVGEGRRLGFARVDVSEVGERTDFDDQRNYEGVGPCD